MKKLILLFLILTLTSCASSYNLHSHRDLIYDRWDYNTRYTPLWWNPYTPQIIIIDRTPRQPKIQGRRTPIRQVQPNRGRSNQTPRKPQYTRKSNGN